MTDRLEEIKRVRNDDNRRHYKRLLLTEDEFDWLITEVDRLRTERNGLLANAKNADEQVAALREEVERLQQRRLAAAEAVAETAKAWNRTRAEAAALRRAIDAIDLAKLDHEERQAIVNVTAPGSDAGKALLEVVEAAEEIAQWLRPERKDESFFLVGKRDGKNLIDALERAGLLK